MNCGYVKRIQVFIVQNIFYFVKLYQLHPLKALNLPPSSTTIYKINFASSFSFFSIWSCMCEYFLKELYEFIKDIFFSCLFFCDHIILEFGASMQSRQRVLLAKSQLAMCTLKGQEVQLLAVLDVALFSSVREFHYS